MDHLRSELYHRFVPCASPYCNNKKKELITFFRLLLGVDPATAVKRFSLMQPSSLLYQYRLHKMPISQENLQLWRTSMSLAPMNAALGIHPDTKEGEDILLPFEHDFLPKPDSKGRRKAEGWKCSFVGIVDERMSYLTLAHR